MDFICSLPSHEQKTEVKASQKLQNESITWVQTIQVDLVKTFSDKVDNRAKLDNDFLGKSLDDIKEEKERSESYAEQG